MVNGNENGSQGEAFRLPPIHKLVSDVAPASEILGSLRYRRHNDNPVKATQQAFGSDRAVLKGTSSPSRKAQTGHSSNPDMYSGTRSGVEGSASSGSGASSASRSSSCDNDELREEAQGEAQSYDQEQEEKEYQEERDGKNSITESTLSGGSSSERSEFASRSPPASGFSFAPYNRSIDAESTTAAVPALNTSFISGKATSDQPYLKEFDDDPRSAFMSDGENNDSAPFLGERRRNKVAKIKKTSTPSSTLQRDLKQDDSQDGSQDSQRYDRHERHDLRHDLQHDLLHDTQQTTQQTTQHEAQPDERHAERHGERQQQEQEQPEQEQQKQECKEQEPLEQRPLEQGRLEQGRLEQRSHEKGQEQEQQEQGREQEHKQDTGNHDPTIKEEEQSKTRRLSDDSISNLQPLEPQPKAQDGIHFSQIPVYSFMHVSPPKAEDAESKSRYGATSGDGGNKHILSGNTPNAAFSTSPQPLPQLPPWISSMKQLQSSEPNSGVSNSDARSPSSTGVSGPNPYDSLNGMSISSPQGTSHSREHSHSSVFEATPYGTGVHSSVSGSNLATGPALDSSAKSPQAMYPSSQAPSVYPAAHTPQPGQFYYPYSHYASIPAVMQYANAQYPGANSRNELLYSASAPATAQPQLMMQHAQLSASLAGCPPHPSHTGHLQSPQMQAYAPHTQVPLQSLLSQHKFPLGDVKQEGGGPDGGGKPLSSAMNEHQPQLAKEHTFNVTGNNSSHPEFHIIDSATGRHLVAEAPRRRGNLPKDVTNVLRAWLSSHLGNPYPTEDDKLKLVEQTGLSMIQVSNWFINARRRSIPATHRKSKYSHYRPEADKSNFQNESGEKRKVGEKDKKKTESN